MSSDQTPDPTSPAERALDARLRALGGALPEAPEAPPVAVARLVALRRGALAPEAEAEVEQALVEDAGARQALYDLAEPLGELEAWAVAQIEAQRGAQREAPRAPQGAEIISFPQRRRWGWIAGGLLAAAAALIFLVMRPEALPPPVAYRVASVQGMIQEVRGEADPHAARIFDAQSAVRITLHPSQAPTAGPPAVQVYVDEPAGVRPVQVQVTERKGAFLIEGDAGKMFGARVGPRFIYVALAQEASALAALAGLASAEAAAQPSIRWVEIPVTFRGAHEP